MPILLLLLSVGAAIVPMVAFLAIVWWLDRYAREPLWVYGLTFVWGGTGAVCIALLGSLALSGMIGFFSPQLANDLGAVAIAPITEEPAKAAFLLWVLWNRHLDDSSDGIVYGAAAGLGFGLTENFLYFSSVASSGDPAAWAFVAAIRTFGSAVMHATCTATIGAFVGFARMRHAAVGVVALGTGLGLALAIHAGWNGIIMVDGWFGFDGKLFWLNALLLPAEVIALFLAFQLGLRAQSGVIREELAEEAASGVIPAAHADLLASWWARTRHDWSAEGLPAHRYVLTATRLALRKRQARSAGAESFHADEVARHRRLLLAMRGLPAATPGGSPA